MHIFKYICKYVYVMFVCKFAKRSNRVVGKYFGMFCVPSFQGCIPQHGPCRGSVRPPAIFSPVTQFSADAMSRIQGPQSFCGPGGICNNANRPQKKIIVNQCNKNLVCRLQILRTNVGQKKKKKGNLYDNMAGRLDFVSSIPLLIPCKGQCLTPI